MQIKTFHQEPEEARHNAILEEDDHGLTADLKIKRRGKMKMTLKKSFVSSRAHLVEEQGLLDIYRSDNGKLQSLVAAGRHASDKTRQRY